MAGKHYAGFPETDPVGEHGRASQIDCMKTLVYRLALHFVHLKTFLLTLMKDFGVVKARVDVARIRDDSNETVSLQSNHITSILARNHDSYTTVSLTHEHNVAAWILLRGFSLLL